MPIHAAYAYDAVLLYARALTEAKAEGIDPRNGTAIFEKIKSRPYTSILGHQVSFNNEFYFDLRLKFCTHIYLERLHLTADCYSCSSFFFSLTLSFPTVFSPVNIKYV